TVVNAVRDVDTPARTAYWRVTASDCAFDVLPFDVLRDHSSAAVSATLGSSWCVHVAFAPTCVWFRSCASSGVRSATATGSTGWLRNRKAVKNTLLRAPSRPSVAVADSSNVTCSANTGKALVKVV